MGSKGKIKQPKKNAGKKIKTPIEPPNTDEQNPVFCLKDVQSDFGLRHCSKDELAALAKTLRQLSQLRWKEIASLPKQGLGYEKIPRGVIRNGIPNVVTEDTTLLAFRFHSKAPMVGFRVGEKFKVIWLDRAFTLYDHGS